MVILNRYNYVIDTKIRTPILAVQKKYFNTILRYRFIRDSSNNLLSFSLLQLIKANTLDWTEHISYIFYAGKPQKKVVFLMAVPLRPYSPPAKWQSEFFLQKNKNSPLTNFVFFSIIRREKNCPNSFQAIIRLKTVALTTKPLV